MHPDIYQDTYQISDTIHTHAASREKMISRQLIRFQFTYLKNTITSHFFDNCLLFPKPHHSRDCATT